jgi:hypothetical protein
VDAAVLEIRRRERPLVAVDDFERYATFVRDGFSTRPDAPYVGMGGWATGFRA